MTPSDDPIRGKVAKILSPREVALTIGEAHGVETGMLFEIMYPGYEIPDPDTGVVLGTVELPKARVKVTRVYDNLSVAATYRSQRVNVGGMAPMGLGTGINMLFQPPKWETRYETLKTKGSFESAVAEIAEADSYVATGDPVVQVLDEMD